MPHLVDSAKFGHLWNGPQNTGHPNKIRNQTQAPRILSGRVGRLLRSDQIVWLANDSTIQHYPDKLRRIYYVDADTGKSLVFLSSNFELPARTIALIYKARWKVELFFKWIKQHLRIKHFYGTRENTVKTQIWISVCV